MPHVNVFMHIRMALTRERGGRKMSFEATKQLRGARLLVEAMGMELNSISAYSSPSFDKIAVQGGTRTSDRVSQMIIRKESMIHSLMSAIEACHNLESASKAELETVPDLEMRAMLTFRYLHNMTWSDIAKKSGEGASPDAVKKRFERSLKAYEAQNTSVAYTEAEERALSWMKSVQHASTQRNLGAISSSSRFTGNQNSLKAGYGK